MRYKSSILLAAVLLTGCAAPVLVMTGIGAASVGVNETTGKTMSDHVVSTVKDQDCKISRSFEGKNMCQPESRIVIVNTGVKPSTVADIEARFR